MAALALILPACGDAPDPDALGQTREASHAACQPSQYVHAWSSGVYNVQIRPTSTHFCWLNRVSGPFDGDQGASAGVYVQGQSDGYWHLVTESTGAYGEARCVPRSCFSGDGVNDVVWVSSGFGALAVADPYSCDQDANNTWWGDAATVLQSWPGPGRTQGGGEWVNAALSTSPWTPSQVIANDCKHGDPYPWIQATANSLFVGTPSGGKLCHYTGVPFAVWGDSLLNLGVYTDQAFCFFTKIAGKYRGGGEGVAVYPVYQSSSGRYLWYAKSWSDTDTSVRGEGRCYYFHQWDL